MRIGIPKETFAGEARVSIIPETVRKLVARKIEVSVEAGAGTAAGFPDDEYAQAGARVERDFAALAAASDTVIKVRPPTLAETAKLREGSTLVSLLYARTAPELVAALARRRITAIATDSIPRTTLAQMMDVLSSQASIAGYRSVIVAAHAHPRLFPMMMTAAGTVSPAKVLVLGAGVAGLQAIATARRLGAVVEAFDVRKAAKEQVESLGARFIEVEGTADAAGAGGYAREVSADDQRKQAELLAKHLAKNEICITTALIPGRRAPTLITDAMLRGMKPGSIVVDLAAEQGGNCEGTPAEGRHVVHGVTLIGAGNLPSESAYHSSQLHSRNMDKLLMHFMKEGELRLELSDAIIGASVMTLAGELIQEYLKPAAAAAPAAATPVSSVERIAA